MSRRRPGNGSATLLDMLSNLFYFSPPPTTPSAVDGERAATRRVANAERRTETERERGREREGEKEVEERVGREPLPSTSYLLLPPPPPPPPLSLSFHRVTLRAHTSTPFSNIASSVPSLLLLLFCWPPLAFSCLPPLFSLASRESGWNRESLATRREEKERERGTKREKGERGVATVVTLGSAICDWEKEEEKEKGKERDGKGGGKRRTWEARGR